MSLVGGMHHASTIGIVSRLLDLVGIAVGILYVLTLWKALRKCSAALRTMNPGLVWLMLIPLLYMVMPSLYAGMPLGMVWLMLIALLGIIWQFFVVLGLGKSLGNEFQARMTLNAERRPGTSVGTAMCVCAALAIMPFFLWIAINAMPQVQSANNSGEWLGELVILALLAALFILSAPAYLVLWIIYWKKIARWPRILDRTSVVSVAPDYLPGA